MSGWISIYFDSYVREDDDVIEDVMKCFEDMEIQTTVGFDECRCSTCLITDLIDVDNDDFVVLLENLNNTGFREDAILNINMWL